MRDDAGTEPRAEHRGADQRDERQDVDRDDRGEDVRLGNRRQCMTGVQRAGNDAIGHEPPQLEERRRGRKRSDAESIEEIGDRANPDLR